MRPTLGVGVRSLWVDIVFPGRTRRDGAAVGSQQSYLPTLSHANKVSCTRYRETAVFVGVMPSKVAPWSPRLHAGVIYVPGLESQTGFAGRRKSVSSYTGWLPCSLPEHPGSLPTPEVLQTATRGNRHGQSIWVQFWPQHLPAACPEPVTQLTPPASVPSSANGTISSTLQECFEN